jgi:hypothetical protein
MPPTAADRNVYCLQIGTTRDKVYSLLSKVRISEEWTALYSRVAGLRSGAFVLRFFLHALRTTVCFDRRAGVSMKPLRSTTIASLQKVGGSRIWWMTHPGLPRLSRYAKPSGPT